MACSWGKGAFLGWGVGVDGGLGIRMRPGAIVGLRWLARFRFGRGYAKWFFFLFMRKAGDRFYAKWLGFSYLRMYWGGGAAWGGRIRRGDREWGLG